MTSPMIASCVTLKVAGYHLCASSIYDRFGYPRIWEEGGGPRNEHKSIGNTTVSRCQLLKISAELLELRTELVKIPREYTRGGRQPSLMLYQCNGKTNDTNTCMSAWGQRLSVRLWIGVQTAYSPVSINGRWDSRGVCVSWHHRKNIDDACPQLSLCSFIGFVRPLETSHSLVPTRLTSAKWTRRRH